MAAPGEAGRLPLLNKPGPAGEAGWTGRSDLTINRPLRGVLCSRSAQVAQLVEHATENRSVGGSIPPLGTNKSMTWLTADEPVRQSKR